MPDNNFSFKAAVVILVVLGGMMFYRMQHPATIFAADGVDPYWDAAAQRSRDLSQPAIVLFTANWCHYCRALEGNVLSRDDVQAELQSHYGFYTVNMTNPSPQVQAHARKLRVDCFPTMIRYDADGKETDRANYLEPAKMIAWLKAGE